MSKHGKKFIVRAWHTEQDYDNRKVPADFLIETARNETIAIAQAKRKWESRKKIFGYMEAEEKDAGDFGAFTPSRRYGEE